MKTAIHSVRIMDPDSPHHAKTRDVLIDNGYIAAISAISARQKRAAERVIHAKGMVLSKGWFDVGTFVGDPGVEHKEDIASVTQAAAHGGFTEIATLPNTQPAVQHKEGVNYLTRHNKDRLVHIHPMAAVTLNHEGNALTEMIDLHHAGAVAFTDGLKPLWNTDVLLKALQYLQAFDGLLIDRPEDVWLARNGQMNEGLNSARLGLKGVPKIAEEMAASRNIETLRYTGGRIHLMRISSPKTVKLVRDAKKSGLAVSCDMAAYQALLDDSLLEGFDTRYKVSPPLREKAALKALIRGIKDHTIDVLTSGHVPQDAESKMTALDDADVGMINLQTFASQLAELSNWVSLNELIYKVTVAPRLLLRTAMPVIEVAAPANLTLFDPSEEWVFTPALNRSKASNSPWLGKRIRGRVKAVFNNAKQWIDE